MTINDHAKALTHRKAAGGARRALAAVSLIAAGTLSLAAQQQAAMGTSALAAASATVTRATVSKVRTTALTSIQGNALNSTNGAMHDVIVRLRDARFGRIVDTQLTSDPPVAVFTANDVN